MSIQKFDVVLLGSSCPGEDVAGFARTLRDLFESSGSRIAFLSCSPDASDVSQFDAHLSDEFDPAALIDLVGRLCSSEAEASGAAHAGGTRDLPVFKPDDFGEQCAQEKDLMVEIIDLFFAECEAELPAMVEALAAGDFERLSRLAHTIKGSLASLHAPVARRCCETLEAAAKNRDSILCTQILETLARHLELLNKHLTAFREACLSG